MTRVKLDLAPKSAADARFEIFKLDLAPKSTASGDKENQESDIENQELTSLNSKKCDFKEVIISKKSQKSEKFPNWKHKF